MEIITVNPRGFCKGVVKAIMIAKETAKQYPNQKITILGELVHNRYVVDALKDFRIQTVESKGNTRFDLLDQVDEGVVIFSAHGISANVIEKAKQKGLITVDASCEDVISTQNLIQTYLDQAYTILYIGQENHPEAEAICDIDRNNIHFIKDLSSINELSIKSNKIFVTNQTTMSILEIKDLLDFIKEKYPQAIISDEICNATRTRQEAILKLEDIDCLIVIGDPKSNNTRMLARIGANKGIKNVYQVETVIALFEKDLKQFNRIAITAGASTPSYLVNQVIAYCNALRDNQNPMEAINAVKVFI
ncbi:MAG TPA: 4-hydroxy-3-methylbut-2-enyl diphosphate reductase [Erysipelotrichaceae bacterium]|nr:4-hydroxy-3-methylbut-2-enyl diphosphate reductase [Erysipelotrichaceae bacterium]